jgi:hypothetical protein
MSYFDPAIQNEAIRKFDERRNNTTTIVIAIIIVLILVVIMFIYYLILRARSAAATKAAAATTTGTSTKCTSNSSCPSTSPACNTTTGLCVQCVDNTTCSGALSKCQLLTNTCVQCNASADCTAPEVCKTGGTTCVTCNVDTDCGCGTCTNNNCVSNVPTVTSFTNDPTYIGGNPTLLLSWTPIPNATSYDVFIHGTGIGGNPASFTTTGLTGSSGYVFNYSVCAGTTAYAQMRSNTIHCTSAYSAQVPLVITSSYC